MIFIEALKVNTSITELKMKSEEEIKTETFKRSKQLNGLKGNEIGDEGARALSEMLQVNTILTSVNLSGEKDKKKGKREEY